MEIFLKEIFGYPFFRPLQKEIIESIVSNNDTLVILNTSAGKSLCYQFPALYLRKINGKGTVIVVSPLISLMEDQVSSLNKLIPNCACYLGSHQKDTTIQSRVFNGEFSLVYITPEKLSNFNISMIPDVYFIAVDEAHCISEWGQSFRPDYLKISKFKENKKIIALTATATTNVQKEIIENLELKNEKIFKLSCNRINLEYIIKPKKTIDEDINDMIKIAGDGNCIIYCQTKKVISSIVTKLLAKKVKAAEYHASLSLETRTEVYNNFCNETNKEKRLQFIVASIAFGMGIDKNDIRTVIHYSIPKSIENYYQETGRAGRDQLNSKCVLYWSYADMYTSGSGVNDQQRKEVLNYILSNNCRRREVLKYFNEDYDKCSDTDVKCDNCLNTNIMKKSNFTNEVRILLESVKNLGEKFGITKVCKNIKNTKKSIEYWKEIHRLCQNNGLIKSKILSFNGRSVEIFKLTLSGKSFLDNNETLPEWFYSSSILDKSELKKTPEKDSQTKTSEKDSQSKTPEKDSQINSQTSSEKDSELKTLLNNYRKEKSGTNPVYTVLGNKTIDEIIINKPKTLEELKNIKGIGNVKLSKYGNDIIKIVCENYL